MNKLKNKTWYFLIILFLVLVCAIESVQAKIITYYFTGLITYVPDPPPYGLSLSVGDPVKGSISYDPSLDLIQSPPSGMSVVIGGATVLSAGDASLQVLNDSYGVDSFNGYFTPISVNGQNQPSGDHAMNFYLADTTQTVFSDTALPDSLDTGSFDIRTGSIFAGSGITVSFSIDTLTLTPPDITWTANKRLTNNAGDSYIPAIAVDGPSIYVAWCDYTPGNYEIYFKKSDDGGTTWTANKRLTNNAGGSGDPAIAVDGPNIYVVWFDDTPGNYEIYFKKSDDGGTTWTANKRLTNNAGASYDPDIAVDGSNIYVVWWDYTPGPTEIYFKKSDDGGITWTANKRLTNNAGDSYKPAIAVDGSNIYVVWEDSTPGNYEIYFKKSDDGGATWTTKRLTYNAGSSWYPSIAVDGSNIYVVWYYYTPGNANSEIYFKKSDNGGFTWTTKRLTYNAGVSYVPAIAVDGSNIYVVWQDNTHRNYEIYFKKSVDAGTTWTTKRLTYNAGSSWYPSIAVDGSNIYVVWQDDTPENYEIYFKKGVLF